MKEKCETLPRLPWHEAVMSVEWPQTAHYSVSGQQGTISHTLSSVSQRR